MTSSHPRPGAETVGPLHQFDPLVALLSQPGEHPISAFQPEPEPPLVQFAAEQLPRARPEGRGAADGRAGPVESTQSSAVPSTSVDRRSRRTASSPSPASAVIWSEAAARSSASGSPGSRPRSRARTEATRAAVKWIDAAGTDSSVRTAPVRSPAAKRTRASPNAALTKLGSVVQTRW